MNPPVNGMKALAHVVNESCLMSGISVPGDTVVITGGHPFERANEIGFFNMSFSSS